MPQQVPAFSALDVVIGLVLLLPCLLFVRKRNWRVFLAGTSTMLVIMSILFFNAARGSFECANSGGMTDDYDAPGICEVMVYAFVLVVDWAILLIYGMNRATALVRYKYRSSRKVDTP